MGFISLLHYLVVIIDTVFMIFQSHISFSKSHVITFVISYVCIIMKRHLKILLYNDYILLSIKNIAVVSLPALPWQLLQD